jgi:hypothetical protein
VFDHPRNPRYPTRWHVRGYGLFTANPFGLSHYKAGFETDGSLRLCAETAVTFRYRVFLHRGGVRDGRVRDAFLGYAVPPAAQAEAV